MKIEFARNRRLISRELLQGCTVAALILAGGVLAPAQASLLDTSFNPGSGANGFINAIVRRPMAESSLRVRLRNSMESLAPESPG